MIEVRWQSRLIRWNKNWPPTCAEFGESEADRLTPDGHDVYMRAPRPQPAAGGFSYLGSRWSQDP